MSSFEHIFSFNCHWYCTRDAGLEKKTIDTQFLFHFVLVESKCTPNEQKNRNKQQQNIENCRRQNRTKQTFEFELLQMRHFCCFNYFSYFIFFRFRSERSVAVIACNTTHHSNCFSILRDLHIMGARRGHTDQRNWRKDNLVAWSIALNSTFWVIL